MARVTVHLVLPFVPLEAPSIWRSLSGALPAGRHRLAPWGVSPKCGVLGLFARGRLVHGVLTDDQWERVAPWMPVFGRR